MRPDMMVCSTAFGRLERLFIVIEVALERPFHVVSEGKTVSPKAIDPFTASFEFPSAGKGKYFYVNETIRR